MEEKESTKVSLSTFLLVLAVLAIIMMGLFIYKLNVEKTAEIKKSTELQTQVNNLNTTINTLNGTINDLQGKINSISNTINSPNSATSSPKTTIDTTKTYNIVGTYSLDDVNHEFTHGIDYIFSKDKVTYEMLDRKEGIFKIIGNKITITYTKFYEPEGTEIENSNATETDELTIVDENTLTQTTSDGKVIRFIKK